MSDLLTIRDFCRYFTVFSEKQIRWMIFRQDDNQYRGCFPRVGRNRLIDARAFFNRMAELNPGYENNYQPPAVHPLAKLTANRVRCIRDHYHTQGWSIEDLSNVTLLPRYTIEDIIHNRIWKGAQLGKPFKLPPGWIMMTQLMHAKDEDSPITVVPTD